MKSFKNKCLVFLFIVVFSLLSGIVPVWAESPVNIMVIDLQRALNTSEPGKIAKEKLKKEMEKEIDVIKNKEMELKNLQDEISRQGLLMKESERKEKEEIFLRKRKTYERYNEDIRADLGKKERKLTADIIGEIISIARKIGQEKGYTLIMEKGPAVIYAVDKIDITDQVIKRYNQEKK